MFHVNDYVSYGLNGVCHIEDIRKDADNETEYYILKPIGNNNMIIMVPINNPKVLMRPTISKDDVLAIIAAMPEMEAMWVVDDKERNSTFKTAVRSGKPEEWIKVVKTIYLEKEVRSAIGKKITKTDEDIMQTAEQKLNEEFAFALNILPNEVVSYISEHIPVRTS